MLCWIWYFANAINVPPDLITPPGFFFTEIDRQGVRERLHIINVTYSLRSLKLRHGRRSPWDMGGHAEFPNRMAADES